MQISVVINVDKPRLRRPRRRAGAVLFAALLLAVPAIALANHQFSDVPPGHLFHDDIDRVFDARIATGCGGGKYCPDQAVTRGQMAAFLDRGLSRVTRTNLLGTATSASAINIGSVTITAGNVTGGYAYALIISTVNAYSIQAGCFCEATQLVLRNSTVQTQEVYMDLEAVNSPADGDTDEVSTSMNVVVVPTGVPQTFTTRFQRTVGTATVYAFGTLVVQIIPFDGNGMPPQLAAPAAAEVDIVGKPED